MLGVDIQGGGQIVLPFIPLIYIRARVIKIIQTSKSFSIKSKHNTSYILEERDFIPKPTVILGVVIASTTIKRGND